MPEIVFTVKIPDDVWGSIFPSIRESVADDLAGKISVAFHAIPVPDAAEIDVEVEMGGHPLEQTSDSLGLNSPGMEPVE